MARTPARKAAAPTPPRPGASGPGPARPERTARNALVILAVIASAGALYWMRGILTPLALAVFLAIMIDSFARRLEHHWPRLPDSLSLAVAIVLSLVIFGVTLVVVADRAVSPARRRLPASRNSVQFPGSCNSRIVCPVGAVSNRM